MINAEKLQEALPLAQKVADIARAVKGDPSTEYADSLENLATVHRRLAKPAKAEPLYLQSIQIRSKAQGPKHNDVAAATQSLAEVCWELGAYAKAIQRYSEALDLFKQAGGEERPYVLLCMNNLAFIYRETGQYPLAEPLSIRATQIAEQLFGPDHEGTATALNNLATLYYDMADCGRAEPLLARALKTRTQRLGPDHPAVANTLNNLAGIYQKLGQYPKAEPLYLRSIDIRRKTLGENHPDVAINMANLAALYNDMGEYEKAESYSLRALDIQTKARGEDSSEVARCLNNLAAFYCDRGRLGEALPLIKQALAIRARALGPSHPAVVAVLENMAGSRVAAGRPREALELLQRARQITEKQTEMILGVTSEADKLAFLRLIEGDLDMRLSLACQYLPDDPDAVALAAESLVRSKGITLEALSRQQDAAALADDRELSDAYAQLRQVLQEMARLTLAGASPDENQIKTLETRKDELEALLSRRSAAFGQTHKTRLADLHAVGQAIPPGAVLVELCRPNLFAFKATGKQAKWLPARYLAFVISPGNTPPVRMMDLGDAATIDDAVGQFRQSVKVTQGAFRGLSLEPIKQESRTKARQELQRNSTRLHDLVFQPLRNHLAGARHVLISPEGSLAGIPFEALIDPKGSFLIEQYTFSYLTAGGELVRYTQPSPKADGVVVLANPDFDMAPDPSS